MSRRTLKKRLMYKSLVFGQRVKWQLTR